MNNVWKEEDAQEYIKVEDNELALLHPCFHQLLTNVKDKRIVDYGCGEGRLLQELIPRGAKGYGYDISSAMLEEARKRLGTNAELQTIRSGEIPLPDNSIDAIVSNLVLMMIPSVAEMQKVIGEINRILIPNGTFTMSITHPCFLDQKHKYYYNQFSSGFNYNQEGEAYRFVLIDAQARGIGKPSFIDYNYSLATYVNLLRENNFNIQRIVEVKSLGWRFPSYLIAHAHKTG